MYFCETCENYYEEDEMNWGGILVMGLPVECHYCEEVRNEEV